MSKLNIPVLLLFVLLLAVMLTGCNLPVNPAPTSTPALTAPAQRIVLPTATATAPSANTRTLEPTALPGGYTVTGDVWLKFTFAGDEVAISNQKAFFCWPIGHSSDSSKLQSCEGVIKVPAYGKLSVLATFGDFSPEHGMKETTFKGKSSQGFGAQYASSILGCAAQYYGVETTGDVVDLESQVTLPASCKSYTLWNRTDGQDENVIMTNKTDRDLNLAFRVPAGENAVYIKGDWPVPPTINR